MKKCFKCGAPAYAQWKICSIDRWRWVCKRHDVELNRLGLQWAHPRSWRKKLSAYITEIGYEDGLE
jgi:hypothetical protein